MLLTTLLAAGALAAAVPAGSDGLTMRVPTAGLDLGRPDHAAVFAARIADASRDICAVHVATLTPNNQGDRRVCERALGQEAVSALPDNQWRRFMRAGGRRALNRLQR